MDRYFARRIPEPETHSTRLVQNQPDRPLVELKRLYTGSVTVNANALLPKGVSVEPTQIVTHEHWDPRTKQMVQQAVQGLEITPLKSEPLVPHRKIGIAGGRTIGGGTSTEALRRAKKKAARNRRGN